MAGIRLAGLRKSYGETEVLRGIDLEIADGEFMVFVGPSGCAKSTTLRLITGLESPTSGEVWIGDTMVNGLRPKDRNLAMVFQSYALFPNMTVRQNLSFGMQVRREDASRIGPEVERIAALLDLSDRLDHKPGALSGGQAQRVALGRAIIRHPQAFLFDEPLSNLDAELRLQMRAEIHSLQRQLGVTTVYVTHDQVEAMTLGDRIAVMREGKIMQVGPPMKLYSDPTNLFVATFLGSPSINLFAADGGDGLPAVEGANGKATAGLRPEKVRIGGGGEVSLRGTVVRSERLGHETLVWVRPEGSGSATLAARTESAEDDRFDDGKEVDVSYSAADVLLFGADGERVRA